MSHAPSIEWLRHPLNKLQSLPCIRSFPIVLWCHEFIERRTNHAECLFNGYPRIFVANVFCWINDKIAAYMLFWIYGFNINYFAWLGWPSTQNYKQIRNEFKPSLSKSINILIYSSLGILLTVLGQLPISILKNN